MTDTIRGVASGKTRRNLELHPKVAAGGLSANLALIILWGVSYWVAVPPEVAAAFTGLLAFIGGYLAPED